MVIKCSSLIDLGTENYRLPDFVLGRISISHSFFPRLKGYFKRWYGDILIVRREWLKRNSIFKTLKDYYIHSSCDIIH